jgi:hypothetical protein
MSRSPDGNLVLDYAPVARTLASFLRATHAAGWFMSGVFFSAIAGAGLTALASAWLGSDWLDAAFIHLNSLIPMTALVTLSVISSSWIRQLIRGGPWIERRHGWLWGAAYAAMYEALIVGADWAGLFDDGIPIKLLAAGILAPGALMGWFLLRRPTSVHLLSTI